VARAPAPLKSSPEREIGGPETGFGETVRCSENPAVVEQRRAAVEALVAEWNPAEQHPAGNLSLQRHEPRPLALGEAFPADQTLHDAMTAHAVALCGSACSSRTQCQLQQICRHFDAVGSAAGRAPGLWLSVWSEVQTGIQPS